MGSFSCGTFAQEGSFTSFRCQTLHARQRHLSCVSLRVQLLMWWHLAVTMGASYCTTFGPTGCAVLYCFVLSCVRLWNDIPCGTTHRQLQSCVMRPATGQPGESRRCRFAQTCSTTPRCWRREPRPAASLCGIWMSDLCCRIFPMRMMVA